MPIYFAKIRIYNYDYSAGASQLSVQTFGNDETDATKNINRMVARWDGVLNYKVAKISNRQIPLQKYVIFCTLKYYNGTNLNNTYMDPIEIHQKRLPLFTKIIEGFLAYKKYADLELSLIDPENRNKIDEWLDSKESIQQLIKNYENAAKASEDFLTQKGIDIDYSWLEMTEEQWEKHKQWENKFVLPHLKKEHPIIHFFKSIKNKTLWQKRKEIRPSIFIRSATWLKSQPAKPKK